MNFDLLSGLCGQKAVTMGKVAGVYGDVGDQLEGWRFLRGRGWGGACWGLEEVRSTAEDTSSLRCPKRRCRVEKALRWIQSEN